jgi:hypothetical protein
MGGGRNLWTVVRVSWSYGGRKGIIVIKRCYPSKWAATCEERGLVIVKSACVMLTAGAEQWGLNDIWESTNFPLGVGSPIGLGPWWRSCDVREGDKDLLQLKINRRISY